MAQLKKPTIKNPALVSAMAEFKAKQNPQTEKEMLDAIAEASFIAPIALQKQLDEVEPDENGQRQMQASLMAVSNKDGSKFFPAFTDWLEFLKWKNDPEADTMVITFDQYCGILLKPVRDQHRDPQGKDGRDEGRVCSHRCTEESPHHAAVRHREDHQL